VHKGRLRAYTLTGGIRVEYPETETGYYLACIYRSLYEHDQLLRRMLVGLAGKNIRKAMEIFLDFCKSGHIGGEEILKIRKNHGDYCLPYRVVTRVLLRLSRRYYNGDLSHIKNLFQCDPSDSYPDHFARFAILRWLSAVYLRVAGANNSIVRDARVFLASPWSRRRLTMGAYSMDLRERVAAAIDEGEGSERQIAKRFRVSVSFVTRLLQRRRDAGTLAPKPHGGGPRPVLGFPEQVRLAMLIAEHPDATLNQLKEWGGFACTPTTIWRTLRRFRQTYKKKTLHASERDDPKVQAKRRRYRREVEQIDAKRLVFVDETGINTAMTPTHAWARRGKRAIGSVPTRWGSTTVIAALGLDGV